MARELIREYADSLGFDLHFQGFEEELESLPGCYSPPEGRLYVALLGDEPVGCVALRPTKEEGVSELKRLYVRPSARGLGAGRLLTGAVIDAARQQGYGRIRLDTIASMEKARALYRSFGFAEIPAYRFNPLPGAVFMELVLD